MVMGGASSAFTPNSIAGLQLWLDASDAATITASGGFIDSWSNKGSLGGSVTATTTQRPATGTRTVNSKNALDFDGSNDEMVLPAGMMGLGSGANTILVTFQSDNLGDATQELVALFNAGSGLRYEVGFTATAIQVQNRSTSSAVTTLADARSTNTKTIGFRRTGTTIDPILNGAFGAAGTNAENFTGTTGKIGTANSPINRFNGALCEILSYNSYLDNTNIGLLQSYEAAKWGIV